MPGPDDNDDDEATATFVRKILCGTELQQSPSEHSIHQSLPALTSSNDVDLQLYAIIAVVLKDFLHPWYQTLTDDNEFSDEILRIIAHCTLSLESRLRAVDLGHLVLHEIPMLVIRHIKNYRRMQELRAQGLSTDEVHAAYHISCPHPALDLDTSHEADEADSTSRSNECRYRNLLVQGILGILLPPEDVRNASLRALLTDIIANVVLGSSMEKKMCKGWFIWNSMNSLCENFILAKKRDDTTSEPDPSLRKSQSEGRLAEYGLLSEEKEIERVDARGQGSRLNGGVNLFWQVIQWLYISTYLTWAVVQGLMAARVRRQRQLDNARDAKGLKAQGSRPILHYSIIPLIGNLFDLHVRTPWLVAGACTLHFHLCSGKLSSWTERGSTLNEYLHSLVTESIDLALFLPRLLSAARHNLFPGNKFPTQAPPEPTTAEIAIIRRRCAQSLLELNPALLTKAIFGVQRSQEEYINEVELELNVWEDEYMNKHLLYQILDLLVARILPEMIEHSPSELITNITNIP